MKSVEMRLGISLEGILSENIYAKEYSSFFDIFTKIERGNINEILTAKLIGHFYELFAWEHSIGLPFLKIPCERGLIIALLRDLFFLLMKEETLY